MCASPALDGGSFPPDGMLDESLPAQPSDDGGPPAAWGRLS